MAGLNGNEKHAGLPRTLPTHASCPGTIRHRVLEEGARVQLTVSMPIETQKKPGNAGLLVWTASTDEWKKGKRSGQRKEAWIIRW